MVHYWLVDKQRPNDLEIGPKFESRWLQMPAITIRDGESFEQAVRRFKKQCEKAGILADLRKHEHYEKPSIRRKKKSAQARKRALKG